MLGVERNSQTNPGYGITRAQFNSALFHCTVSIHTLLCTLLKLAVMLIAVPGCALPDTVPRLLPLVRVKSVVSVLIQVTEVVMSCCVLLPANVASALNVTVPFTEGVVVDAVSTICVGAPSLTVTVVVAAATVPSAAEMVVVQIPVTVATGLTRPLPLMVAQDGVPELHSTFPVKSLVEPSL